MSGFSRSLEVSYDKDTSITFHRVILGDSIVLNVAINGIIDTTFQINPRPLRTLNHTSFYTGEEEEEEDYDSKPIAPDVEPQLLMGNHSNLKVQVVASEIAKLLCTLPACLAKDKVLLSIGLKWWGRDNNSHATDFERIMFVLQNLKALFV